MVARKRDQPNEYLDEICGDEALKNVVRSFDYILENRRPIRAFGNVSRAKKGHLNGEVIKTACDGRPNRRQHHQIRKVDALKRFYRALSGTEGHSTSTVLFCEFF